MLIDTGPQVSKFRINVPDARVRGRVLRVGSTTAPPSDMDISPDAPYLNLCLPPPAPQAVHCEAYTYDGSPYTEAWPTVIDGGARRNVRVGDRIMIKGTYVFDNGLHSSDESASPGSIVQRGLLRGYRPKVEFHPYANDDTIVLLDDSALLQEHWVACVAPFYGEVYDGKWWWNRVLGIDMHIVKETIANERKQSWRFPAPPLPAGATAAWTHRLEVAETIVNQVGTAESRVLTDQGGAEVQVQVAGTDMNAPAMFLARYLLQWVPIGAS